MAPLPDTTHPPPDTRLGTTLRGKLRLDRLIGTGGMAAVYSATHRNGRRFAVKVLTSTEPVLRDRFLREGRVANTVGHPGAVQVYDEDTTEDGAAFLVMELLEGEPLDALLERRGGRFPPLTVLRLADQLLDVLAAAHARGIVHRDIKPQNLFLTRDGVLKVLDFGVARLRQRITDDNAADTQTGVILGTIAYMAPEQASAQRERIDGRSDLWSVGATMFRMLTGRVVHEAETDVSRLLAAITRTAPSLGTVMPWLAVPVVSVVDRALAFTPEHRWPDARTMQCAVRLALGWLEHGPEARGAAPTTLSRSGDA